MRTPNHEDWAQVAANLIKRPDWDPAVTVELTLNPGLAINKKLTRKGQLIWDATIQDHLRNIVGKHLHKFVRRKGQKRHWRWTVGVGQSKSGAIGFHIVGFTYRPEGEFDARDKMMIPFLLAQSGDWTNKRGSEIAAEEYGKDGKHGKLNYVLNHHTILMIDELYCPRVKRPCRSGRCVCKK